MSQSCYLLLPCTIAVSNGCFWSIAFLLTASRFGAFSNPLWIKCINASKNTSKKVKYQTCRTSIRSTSQHPWFHGDLRCQSICYIFRSESLNALNNFTWTDNLNFFGSGFSITLLLFWEIKLYHNTCDDGLNRFNGSQNLTLTNKIILWGLKQQIKIHKWNFYWELPLNQTNCIRLY